MNEAARCVVGVAGTSPVTTPEDFEAIPAWPSPLANLAGAI
jgi:hypothetical protein